MLRLYGSPDRIRYHRYCDLPRACIRTMISLTVTDKQAAAFHMIYYIGAMCVAGDSHLSTVMMTRNVCEFLAREFNHAERETIKQMMTNFGKSIDRDVLTAMHVQLFDDE